MPTTSRIESSVQSFVAEITSLVRVAALEAVRDALGGGASKRRGPGRPRGSGAKRGPGRPKGAGMKARPARSGKRIRRSAADLEGLASKFLAYVKSHDGQRLEEISRGLGIATSELKHPASMLLAAKAVRTTGAKRGTMYHAGKGSKRTAKKPAKAKRRGKKVARKARKARGAKRGRKAKAAKPAMTAAPEPSAA